MFGTLTYLSFELFWAVPILLLQWLVGWRALWRQRGALGVALAISTAYLSAADGVALAAKIWQLHHDRIIGLYIGNVPLEEVLFFLFTNALVLQAVLLLLDAETQARARGAFARLPLRRVKRAPSRT